MTVERTESKLKAERIQSELKAERIQSKLKAERIQEKLKAERIQQRLAELPGWEVGEGDGALVKSYVFPTVRAASLFAALVVEMGAAVGHAPTMTQRRREVEIEIATDFDGGLSELDLDLARFFDHTL